METTLKDIIKEQDIWYEKIGKYWTVHVPFIKEEDAQKFEQWLKEEIKSE